jgi:hypothetical protein
MIRTAALACSLLMICAPLTAQAGEREDREAISNEAAQAVFDHDFGKLERLNAAYTRPPQRTASGAFKIQLFYDGIASGLEQPEDVKDTGAYYQSWLDMTKAWIAQHPGSAFAYIMHAKALEAYAHHFRGDGLANTVPAEAWAPFRKYTEQAAEFLLRNAAAANGDPGWYDGLLDAGRSLGWPNDALRRVADEGIGKHPGHLWLYLNLSDNYYPKWNGSTRKLDEFINDVARRDPAGDGAELYARLYSGASQGQYRHRLYVESHVDWRKMKTGLEVWYARFPTTWNKNIFAYHACIAQDAPTAARLLKELGDNVDVSLWAPNGRAVVEGCRKWLE